MRNYLSQLCIFLYHKLWINKTIINTFILYTLVICILVIRMKAPFSLCYIKESKIMKKFLLSVKNHRY